MAPDRARYIDSWTRLLQQPSRAFSFFANERRGGDPSIQEVNLLLGGDSFRLHAGLESPSSLDDVIITCVKGQVPSGFSRKLIFFWNVRVHFTLFTQEKGRENVHVELMEQFFLRHYAAHNYRSQCWLAFAWYSPAVAIGHYAPGTWNNSKDPSRPKGM